MSSIRIDCSKLVVLSGRRVVVVVGKQYGKEAQLVLFPFCLASERRVSLACGMVPRLQRGSEVVPSLL